MSRTTDRRPSLCWEIGRCVDCGRHYGVVAVDFEHDPNFRPVPLATTGHVGEPPRSSASGPRRLGRGSVGRPAPLATAIRHGPPAAPAGRMSERSR